MILLINISYETGVFGQECTTDGNKCDTHEKCAEWRGDGECVKNRSYMLNHCPASCEAEDAATNFKEYDNNGYICKDRHEKCPIWAEQGDCEDDSFDMGRFCPESCGKCDDALDDGIAGNTETFDDEADNSDDEFVENDDYETDEENEEEEDDEEDDDDDACKDDHKHCKFWADSGECDANPRYMKVSCKKSCNVCTVDSEMSQYSNLKDATKVFGKRQIIEHEKSEEVAALIQEVIHYMEDPKTQQLPEKVLRNCKNRNKLCAFWAVIGKLIN